MNKKLKIFLGSIFLIVFILSLTSLKTIFNIPFMSINTSELVSLISLMLSVFVPREKLNRDNSIRQNGGKKKLSKRTLIFILIAIVIVPATLLSGTYILKDKKYYFISILIIIETLLPFFIRFENRKPEARELVLLSVICAIAVCSRGAFFMLQQFKPIIAIIIIAGVCFGGEAGFLVGAISGFVSNFFFGQGPWTTWQMFAFGIIGLISGILFKKGLIKNTRLSLTIYGGLATLIIYGGIMNPASVIMWQPLPTIEMIVSSYIMGFPFDLVHAVSGCVFLWLISGAMIEKLERVKTKYGIFDI